MADEQPKPPAEKLQATVLGHSLTLTTRDLLQVVFILGLFLLLWMGWQDFRIMFREQFARQDAYFQKVMASQAADKMDLILQTQELLKALAVHEWNMTQPPEKRVPLHLSPEALERLKREYRPDANP